MKFQEFLQIVLNPPTTQLLKKYNYGENGLKPESDYTSRKPLKSNYISDICTEKTSQNVSKFRT